MNAETAAKDGYIVGGTEVDIRKFPHQVSLRLRNYHKCGASIISAKHCLTAAHCYDRGTSVDMYSILAGSTASRGPNMAHGTAIQVTHFICHEQYGHAGYAHDIAVLVLASSLPVNGVTIHIVPMPRQNEAVPFGHTGLVSGW